MNKTHTEDRSESAALDAWASVVVCASLAPSTEAVPFAQWEHPQTKKNPAAWGLTLDRIPPILAPIYSHSAIRPPHFTHHLKNKLCHSLLLFPSFSSSRISQKHLKIPLPPLEFNEGDALSNSKEERTDEGSWASVFNPAHYVALPALTSFPIHTQLGIFTSHYPVCNYER